MTHTTHSRHTIYHTPHTHAFTLHTQSGLHMGAPRRELSTQHAVSTAEGSGTGQVPLPVLLPGWLMDITLGTRRSWRALRLGAGSFLEAPRDTGSGITGMPDGSWCPWTSRSQYWPCLASGGSAFPGSDIKYCVPVPDTQQSARWTPTGAGRSLMMLSAPSLGWGKTILGQASSPGSSGRWFPRESLS